MLLQKQISYEETAEGFEKRTYIHTYYIPIEAGRSFAEKKAEKLRRKYPKGNVTLEEGYFHGWMYGGCEYSFIIRVITKEKVKRR